MVQEATRFTDEDVMEYIRKNKANIQNLSRKFYYFTYLKKADLIQEGRLKIIELLRAFENDTIKVSLEDLDRYIGRCLVNHYVSLVRKYPTDDYFDPLRFAYSHGENTNETDDCLIYLLLEEALNDREYDIAVLLLEGHTRKQVSELLQISPRALTKIVRKIKLKLRESL